MRKIVFLLLLISIDCCFCVAQKTKANSIDELSSLYTLKSPNQQIIEQVVNSGVFIIKQEYELSDSANQYFGLNGRKAFGIDYTLGIKIKKGFVYSEKTLYPWKYNQLFDQYKDRFYPKLFQTSYSELSRIARYDEFEINKDSSKVILKGVLYSQDSDAFFGDGFSVGGRVGENKGWIVWFTTKKDKELSETTELNLTILKKDVVISEINNNSCFYSVDTLITDEIILGGIFVIPEITSIGHLELKICGIMCIINDEWELFCPFVNYKGLGGIDKTFSNSSIN